MVDGRLNFDTKIDTKGFSKGLSSIENQMSGLISICGKAAAALGALLSGKELIESAAEVKALNAQFEQTFGSLQSQAQAAIATVAEQGDILATRLQGTATKIYAFAKTSGMDSASALGLMNEALQVTADSAAYYDRSLEDTAETLQSFLKGNYANDAALGLSATETTRNAAANKLYGKSFQELSEAQKQLTLLQMVKDANELSGAMGQAAREADGWENVTGNLKESWKQLMAAIGEPMLALAVPVVKSLTAELSQLTAIAQSAAAALEKVFGINVNSDSGTAHMADDAGSAADSYADMAESAEEAAEANKRSLASFDKINKLSEDNSSGSSASSSGSGTTTAPSSMVFTPTVDTSDAESKFDELFRKIKKTAGELLDPFKDAWDNKGQKVIDSLSNEFDKLKGLGAAVGASIFEVWTNGTGQETLEHILGIFSNINDFTANIAENLTNAWTEDGLGTDVIQHAADILNIILDHTEKISKSWADWAKDVDFAPALESFDKLEEALAPLVDDMGDALEWLNEDVLQPIASWTIEDAIPATLDLISSSISALSDIWETAAPVVKDRLWDGFLKPIASWTADKSIKLVKKLADNIKQLGSSVTEEDVNILLDLAEGITAVVLACKGADLVTSFLTAISGMSGKIDGAWKMATAPIGAAAAETGTAAGATLGTTIFAALAAAIAGWTIGSIIYDKWSEEIDSVLHPIFFMFEDLWDNIRIDLEQIWDELSDYFLSMSEGWKHAIEESKAFFTEDVPFFFVEMWNSIKETLADWGAWFASRWADIESAFINTGTWFRDKFNEAWRNIKSAFSSIGSWARSRWSDVTSAFSSVGTWFGEKFTTAWGTIKSAFANVKTFFEGLWKDIKSPFETVATWFEEKFSAAWQKVKDVFSTGGDIFDGIKDGIADVFKDVVNHIIDGINVVISTPFNTINDVLQTLRDTEIAGWNPFADIPTLDVPQIPRLATGTVVPANYGEFLAVLGDNKTAPEIVAPEPAIRQAVLEALTQYGSVSGSGQKVQVVVPLYVNGREIGRAAIDDINAQIRQNGRSPIMA